MAIRKLFCQDQLDSDMPLQTSFIIPSWGHVQLDDAEDRQEPCVGHASQAGKRGRNDLWVLLKGSWKLGYLRLFEYIWVWSSRTWNLDILMLKQIYRVFWCCRCYNLGVSFTAWLWQSHQVGSRPSTVVQLMNAVYQEDMPWCHVHRMASWSFAASL